MKSRSGKGEMALPNDGRSLQITAANLTELKGTSIAALEIQSMMKKVTKDILESYLNCKTKAQLKLAGERGIKSDYEGMILELKAEVSLKAIEKILSNHAEEDVAKHISLTMEALSKGPAYILDATFEDAHFSLSYEGLKKIDGSSNLGDFHYVPMLFHAGGRIGKEQRRLLEIYGLLLSRIQGRMPTGGILWWGSECQSKRIQSNVDLRQSERVIQGVKACADLEDSDMLILNDHCQICEYQQRCYEQAFQSDNLSLLRAMGEKAIKKQHSKGIFTVTQFAHTFRPRRNPKRAVHQSKQRYHALQARAIRDNTLYVFGTPEFRESPVRIYFDVESNPLEEYVYLIGMIIIDNGLERRCSFWADTKKQELEIFDKFLIEIAQYDDFQLFCYGAFEQKYLHRMRKKTVRQEEVDSAIKSVVNTLSLIYMHYYFPTWSNGLKSIGASIGCSWSEPKASSIQSIVWRVNWAVSQEEHWKEKLITYNLEDCAALKAVTELIESVGKEKDAKNGSSESNNHPITTSHVSELDKVSNERNWGAVNFFHAEYEQINRCAYFDYQRERVFVRTNHRIKKCRAKSRGSRNRKIRVSQRVKILATKCPVCESADISDSVKPDSIRHPKPRVKRAFDLVYTPGGIRRRVIACKTSVYHCLTCNQAFIPEAYIRLDKHFHGVKSWVIYQHVEHQLSLGAIQAMIEEFFGIRIVYSEIHMFKSLMVQYYQDTYDQILAKILAGNLLHIDETEVKLQNGKAYVWVLTNLEEVVFMFRPSRQGDFLQELLKDFQGVLVSDFYFAYDSLNCQQQKCLIHLMRDINQLLLNNPYDEELQAITKAFGILLRSIIESIDQYGLKHSRLKKHICDVRDFYNDLSAQRFYSDVAESLKERFLKYQDKLWTFLQHDGIPWNNNNAEHAIKRFAYYRERTVGMMRETGLQDYLLLLSICETCRYKGVRFLQFLLSRNRNIDHFCERKRLFRRSFEVEVYPEGFIPPHFRSPGRSRSYLQNPFPEVQKEDG